MDDELGGAWYLLTGAANGYAGDDLKVLVMQITSAGVPSGILNAQVIPASERAMLFKYNRDLRGRRSGIYCHLQ